MFAVPFPDQYVKFNLTRIWRCGYLRSTLWLSLSSFKSEIFCALFGKRWFLTSADRSLFTPDCFSILNVLSNQESSGSWLVIVWLVINLVAGIMGGMRMVSVFSRLTKLDCKQEEESMNGCEMEVEEDVWRISRLIADCDCDGWTSSSCCKKREKSKSGG